MSGKRSRDKGNRAERLLVNTLRDAGLDAVRVPLSGAAEGFKDDVILNVPCDCEASTCLHRDNKRQVRIEVKHRADGFKQIYNWIANSQALAIKADRKPFLVVVRLEDWIGGIK